MAHQIVGWVAVAIAVLILYASLMTRRGKREAMAGLPIGLFALIIGLWQLGVLPLGQFLSDFTGIGKR